MRIVIKLAGALLEDDQMVRTLASQVAALAKDAFRKKPPGVVQDAGRKQDTKLNRQDFSLS